MATVIAAVDTFMKSADLAAMRTALGIGAGLSPIIVPKLTITPASNSEVIASTGYSLTGASAVSAIDIAGTWNTSGTPTLIKVNVTNTLSNANSLLLDLQVGGVSVHQVDKTGWVVVPGYRGIASIGNLAFNVNLSGDGIIRLNDAGGGTYINSKLLLGSTTDLVILRDAANTLAQRNGVNAQAFNLYNTYTSGSVYERGFMRWVSNVLEIGTEHLGGTQRDIRLRSGPNGDVYIRAGGSGTNAAALKLESTAGTLSTTLGSDASTGHTYLNGVNGLRMQGRLATAGVCTTTELPTDKMWSLHKNTSSGAVTLCYNDSGTIKTVTLA